MKIFLCNAQALFTCIKSMCYDSAINIEIWTEKDRVNEQKNLYS